MYLVIACVLVFFPASIAIAIHDRLNGPLETAGRRLTWYGIYSAVISWLVLAIKFVKLGGNMDILSAFGEIRQLVVYGLLAIITAVLAPMLLSVFLLLSGKFRKRDSEGKRE